MLPDPEGWLTANLLLRGATVGLLVLIAAALWPRRSSAAAGAVAARLGAAFAIGIAAATLAGMPRFGGAADAAHALVAGLAAGAMFLFWLFTRALLDDEFRPRPWHAAAWGALAALGAANCLLVVPHVPALVGPLGVFFGAMPVAWALLAVAQSLASWRADLVEGRRRLRTLIVAATSVYTVGQLLAALLLGASLKAVVESPLNAAGTAALTLYVAWRLLRLRADELFAPPERASAPALAEVPKPDARQLATLERLIGAERVYREPSLTIAALAARMGLPEHRLRKLINQGLGHRNFNAFLNAYRIDDAKRALRDPALAAVPVLTIALDAGFQSIGPFNRAFKAATGVTPTEFRRQPATVPAEAEIA